MELTTEDIAVLRDDKKGGFTDESIALLIHDKAPQKVKYAANKILNEYRRELKAEAKAKKDYERNPVTRGEVNNLENKIAACVNPLIENVYVTADILEAKEIITKDERDAFVAEDVCEGCTSVRPLVGGYCPEVLTKGGGKAITSHDVWPSVEYSLVDKVLQCSLYEKKA